MSDDKITKLPIRFKAPPGTGEDDPHIKIAQYDGKCDHKTIYISTAGLSGVIRDVQYLVREGETEVECGGCGTRLDPMFVIMQIARKDSRHAEQRKKVADELKRLGERKQTKCENCGKMTRISRR